MTKYLQIARRASEKPPLDTNLFSFGLVRFAFAFRVSRLTRSVLHYYIVCCFCLALSVCHCHWHGRVEHSASAPCHTDVLHRVQASERAPFCLQLVMRQQTIVYSFSNTTAKMRRLVATTAAMRHKRLPRDTVCLHSTRPPPVAPCFSADSSNFSNSSGFSSCYRQGANLRLRFLGAFNIQIVTLTSEIYYCSHFENHLLWLMHYSRQDYHKLLLHKTYIFDIYIKCGLFLTFCTLQCHLMLAKLCVLTCHFFMVHSSFQ